jgi:hypothetical protein
MKIPIARDMRLVTHGGVLEGAFFAYGGAGDALQTN